MQGKEKGEVAKRRATAADAETALDAVLWLNQAAIITAYSLAAQQPQREAAANYSLLYRPAAGDTATTYADYLAAGAVADVRADEPDTPLPAPSTRLVLRNPGRVRLQLALGKSATDFPKDASVREVAPGATLTLLLGELGDAAACPSCWCTTPPPSWPASSSRWGKRPRVLGMLKARRSNAAGLFAKEVCPDGAGPCPVPTIRGPLAHLQDDAGRTCYWRGPAPASGRKQ